MSDDTWDEVAKEADLLRGAIITGTLKARHVELGPVDPKAPDTATQRDARRRQATTRAMSRDHRNRNARALDEHLGTSPYPDVATTYPRVSLRPDGEPTEEQVRQAANDLVRQGWPAPIVARLLNIQPRS